MNNGCFEARAEIVENTNETRFQIQERGNVQQENGLEIYLGWKSAPFLERPCREAQRNGC